MSLPLYHSTALRFETKAARRLNGARGQLPVFFLPYSNLQGKKEQGVSFLFFFKLAPTLLCVMYYVVCFSLIERRVFSLVNFCGVVISFFGGLSFFSALLTNFGVFFFFKFKNTFFNLTKFENIYPF